MSSASRLHQISARQVNTVRRVKLKGFLRGQIDALVYDLYALTPAEIKIVEGAVK